MSGNTCNDGGGTPEGIPSGYMKGTRGLNAMSEAGWPGGIEGMVPPAAKTAGGMA